MAKTQVTAGDIKDASITDADIAAANKDGAQATPSLRTLSASAPAAVTIDSGATAGAGVTASPSSHVHQIATSSAAPVTQAFGDAAAAGTSGTAPSRGDHKHGMPSPTVTKSFWLWPANALLNAATLVALGSGNNQTRALALADAATQSGIWNFAVPYDWDSGGFTVTPYWAPGSTDAAAHAVRWQLTSKARDAAGDVTGGGTADAWTGAAAARTANLLVIDTPQLTSVVPTGIGQVFGLAVLRVGADAADTYAGVVNLVGVLVSYTANR